MNPRILLAALVLAAPHAFASQDLDSAHRKFAFLCEWTGTHMPASPQHCRAEEISSSSSAALEDATDAFWRHWNEALPYGAGGLKADVDRAYKAKYSSVSVQDPCRDGLSSDERRLAVQHEVLVGMSQAALLCSWGAPLVRMRDVTAAHERVQWKYDDRRVVYTVDGIVTVVQQ